MRFTLSSTIIAGCGGAKPVSIRWSQEGCVFVPVDSELLSSLGVELVCSRMRSFLDSCFFRVFPRLTFLYDDDEGEE